MTGFRNMADYARAQSEGRASVCSFRKVPSQASTAGWWVDLSMAAGNPVPNYYASEPLVAATLTGTKGIFHGTPKAPSCLFLTEMALTTPTAGLVGAYRLLDYLLYYPFLDGDSTDEQALDNTVTLPRYTSGNGVEAMLVASAPSTGSGQFTYTYVDADGVTRVSPTQFCSVAAANIASVVTSEQATAAGGRLFLRKAGSGSGIRRVNSVTFSVPNGGLTALVLVKPIATIAIYEVNTTSEQIYVQHVAGAPQIEDGAYLGLVMNCAATVAAGTLSGRANFAWSE